MNKNILEKKANKKQLIILFIIVAAIASISYSKFYSKKAEKTKDDIEKQTRLFQVLCKHKKLI